MNKTELSKAVARKCGLTQDNGAAAVNALFEILEGELRARRKVVLLGFGTFSVVSRPARNGVNPATGAKITIPAKRVPRFKPGSRLAATLNGGRR